MVRLYTARKSSIHIILVFVLSLLSIGDCWGQTAIYDLQTGIVISPISFGSGADAGTITCSSVNNSGNSSYGACVLLKNARVTLNCTPKVFCLTFGVQFIW